MSGRAFCRLCDTELPLEALAAHLLDEHGIDLERDLERWPDGEPVVVDHTLEPDEFG